MVQNDDANDLGKAKRDDRQIVSPERNDGIPTINPPARQHLPT